MFHQGRSGRLLDTLTEDVQWNVVGPPETFPLFGERSGRDGAIEYFRQLADVLQVTQISPSRFLVDGDTVVVTGHSDGVMRKTGETVRSKWVHVFTVRGGQIASYEEFVDPAVVFKALGAA